MTDSIEEILRTAKRVAVVGISDREERPSHRVAGYLKEKGYRMVPVNPKLGNVFGETCYPDLEAVPGKIDVVDIFRRSEDVLPIVQSAVSLGVKGVWMQEGIVNEEAAALARSAGLLVVMDRCMLKEHRRLFGDD